MDLGRKVCMCVYIIRRKTGSQKYMVVNEQSITGLSSEMSTHCIGSLGQGD